MLLFRKSGHPGNWGKDKPAVWKSAFRYSEPPTGCLDWTRLWNPFLLAGQVHLRLTSSVSWKVHSIASVRGFVRGSSSTLSYLDVCLGEAAHWLSLLHAAPLPNLFFFFFSSRKCCQVQGQYCPLKSRPRVTVSKWGISVGHEKEGERERNSGRECVCAAARWCV